MKTIDDVKNEFFDSGVTMVDWAKKNGYPYQIVQRILNGQSKYIRGRSHEVAIKLGLKEAKNNSSGIGST